jgi:response regulator RpfG family c-di-GMP phosphodiesterase
MNRRILCVDDEKNVLEALERNLYDQFDVTTAESGHAALALLNDTEPFAVVVSDMRMPGMSGAELLARIRQSSPDTVRILLTGHSDMDDAVAAVNRGGIYRFLCKPCPTDELISSIEAGVRQFGLSQTERQVLEETVAGVVKAFAEVLAIASPTVFRHVARIRSYVEHMLAAANRKPDWRIELAAQLALIGCIALPPELANKILSGASASLQERQLFEKHPETGRKLIATIPRLEPVAEIVGHQLSHNLGVIEDEQLRFGAEVLQMALSVSDRVNRGDSIKQAIRHLSQTVRLERRDLLETLASFENLEVNETQALPLKQLRAGMILESDVETPNGNVVLQRGRQLTLLHLDRLKHFAEGVGIVEPINVRLATQSSERLRAASAAQRHGR